MGSPAARCRCSRRAVARVAACPAASHALAGAALLGLLSCHSAQSALEPISPPAHTILHLTILVFVILCVIFVGSQGAMFYSLLRFRRPHVRGQDAPQIYGSRPIEVAWTVAPGLIVVVLFFLLMRTIIQTVTPLRGTIDVTVVGHQWWWEFDYPALGVRTADELHVPAGETVRLRLESADVIHSFWVPRLAGKTDVIPGHPNLMWFRAEATGLYLGSCGEFCGVEHARMRIRVIAEPRAEFDRWVASQRLPAASPTTPAAAAGRALFLANACASCHAVVGTPARGVTGPDLTHVMSRQTLGADTLPNTPGALAAWIRHPQIYKPGNLMPDLFLPPDTFDAITAYVETLR